MFYKLVLLLQLTGQAVCYQHLRSRTGDVVRVFREFEDQFDRGYRRGKGGRRGEEIERFRIFRKHYVEVARHNAEHVHPDYFLELNKFSDLADRELQGYLGLKGNVTEELEQLERGQVQGAELEDEEEEEDLVKRGRVPADVDHQAAGIVTPIKNQGLCGACWGFASVDAFESAYKQATGYLKSFSVQEILDCYYEGQPGVDGCDGGKHYEPFIYVASGGRLATYNSYRYTGRDGPCTSLPENGIKNARLATFRVVKGKDKARALEKAAVKRVLAVTLHASTMFYYRSGVFNSCPTYFPAYPDHAMVLTGFTQQYWLVLLKFNGYFLI